MTSILFPPILIILLSIPLILELVPRNHFYGLRTRRSLSSDAVPLPIAERHIPPALARIVDRCLEKNPAGTADLIRPEGAGRERWFGKQLKAA